MLVANRLTHGSAAGALDHALGADLLNLVQEGVSASAEFAVSLRAGMPVQVGRPREQLLGVLIALQQASADAARLRAEVLLDDGREARTEACDLNRAPDDVVDYDRYFDIQRVPSLTFFEQLVFSIPVMIDASATLARAPGLSGDYAAMIADQIRRSFQSALESLTSTCARAPITDPATGGPRAVAPVAVELTPLKRWRVGHQMYGLANREAACHVYAAVAAWRTGVPRAVVVDHLQAAAEAVGAITATMLYAASLTSSQYVAEVRPTMAYPRCPNDLTGGMNLDHARYRAAMVEFLTEFDMRYENLVTADRAVAEAREILLASDLMDLTEHITLTHRLVGTAPALDERDDGSAVQQLRSMLVDRTQQYAYLQRLGERTHRDWSFTKGQST